MTTDRLPAPRRFHIEGLHCANCAGKIERALAAEPDMAKVSLDLMGQTLVLESTESAEALLPRIQQIADGIEGGTHFEIAGRSPSAPAGEAHLKRFLKDHQGEVWAMGATVLLVALGLALERFQLPLFIAAYLAIATPVLLSAGKGVLRGDIFGEEMLMAVASAGAFGIGASTEAIAVMLFYRVGELAQDLAVDRSRRSISELLDIKPELARKRFGEGDWREIDPEDVRPGDLIAVRPGEKIPLDGIVRKGRGLVDAAALTGESVPVALEPGATAYSGAINLEAVLVIEVTAVYEDSAVAKILALVENASQRKAPTERFITRFARVYTPLVVGAAALLFAIPVFVLGLDWHIWIYRALLFLVCGCPCALVLSVPLSFFAGVGGASKAAILVKGANYLEALSDIKTIVFDKTGTLTEGRFQVEAVHAADGDEAALLALAAAVEAHSNHPIARSVVERAGQMADLALNHLEEVPGRGLRAWLDGDEVLVGARALLTENGIAAPAVDSPGSVVYIARGGRYLGHLEVVDRPKKDAADALRRLHDLGVERLVLLSGDRQASVAALAENLGIDRYRAELLPQDKVAAFEDLQRTTAGRIAYVGDGINDAPTLARADVGIAMGALGSDAAIEAADVVLMTDEVGKIPQGIAQARHTRAIVWQNVIFALAVKALIMLLGALGIATMWAAVFADVGVALICILNAMRALNVPTPR